MNTIATVIVFETRLHVILLRKKNEKRMITNQELEIKNLWLMKEENKEVSCYITINNITLVQSIIGLYNLW